MKNFNFKLDVFEGPLDLLLHLISVNKINIYDIPIAYITNQYVMYIETMQELNMDVTGDFMVMAAQLLYIKSKSMLPKEEDDTEEEDFKTELTDRLVEYKKVKEAAQKLGETQFSSLNNYFKKPEKLGKMPVENPSMESWLLIRAFEEIIDRQERLKPPPRSTFKGIAEREKISMSERTEYVLSQIRKGTAVSFKSLFKSEYSRPLKIATFLVILHLVSRGNVLVFEKNNEVYLEKGENTEDEELHTPDY